jgi:hypothetical protein
MVDSKEVEIFFENGVVPLVLYVKDARVVVHDHTLSTKFKFLINSTFSKESDCNIAFYGRSSMGHLARAHS